MNKNDLVLYLVTDRDMVHNTTLEIAIERAILGGVTIVQLREKKLSHDEFVRRAKRVKVICDRYNIPLIINDNVDVCREVNASGVHLGSQDMSIAQARNILGNDKIIGASARSVVMAKRAEMQGADYLGVGAVFGTSTKSDAVTISPSILKDIASSVDIPVVAIGGVSLENVEKLKDTCISGVAVISSILKSNDIMSTSMTFREKLKEVIK